MIDGRYTEEEWRAIVAEGTWVAIDKTQIPVVQELARKKLEEAAAIFASQQVYGRRMAGSKLKRDQWAAIGSKAIGLLNAVREVDDWIAPIGLCETDSDGYGGRAEAVSAIENLIEQAKLNVEEYGSRVSDFSGQQNPDRGRLYSEVLHVWDFYIRGDSEDKNGNPRRGLRLSKDKNGNTSGPLVRFMTDALTPIMGDDTPRPNAIKDIVKRERAAREKPSFHQETKGNTDPQI